MSTQDKKFIYSGPSWALQSFDTSQGREPNPTSLLQEWGLAHIADNVSGRGSNFVRQFRHFTDTDLPIVYVMCEPLVVYENNMKRFGKYQHKYNGKWQELWQHRRELNRQHMHQLAELPNRVAVIGAHSDVSDVPDSITVIDPSWQNYLRLEAGLDTGYNWGVEVLHRQMFGGELIYRFSKSDDRWINTFPKASRFIVDLIHDQFEVWKALEKHNLFCDVHPNRRANELYAQHTLNSVLEFVNA